MKEQKNTKSIYNLKFPVKIALRKEEEPLHWHKDLEILCVLKGKVNLQVNNAFYELGEDDIFLINSEDLHSICLVQEKSVYIFVNIVLMYFEKFFKELEYIIFIDDNSINTSLNEELQKEIRWRIAQMLIEIKNKNVDYQNRIIYHASSLLAGLIDNYNMVKKNIKSFKSKDQLSRIWNAYEYMYIHYAKRIELEEVAKHVHVSSSYLSHTMKGAMGLSFEKLLNQIRAEHSMKFLLTSDDSITKISKECGFSDPKYYKNYFFQFFHCMPEEYRESNQHKIAEGDFEAVSYFETLVFNELLVSKINQYLDDPVKDMDESVVDISVDFSTRKERIEIKKEWKKEVVLSNAEYGEVIRYMDNLRILQNEIGFEYIYIKDMINSHFFKYQPDHTFSIDWNELDHLIELIIGMKAHPKLDLQNHKYEEGAFVEILQKILLHYKLKYGEAEVQKWILVFNKKGEQISSRYVNTVEDLVNSICRQMQMEYIPEDEKVTDYDISDKSGITLLNEIIINHKKIENRLELLLDRRGLKSNLFFAYLFLNKLENQIISIGENFLITKGHNRLVILAFNCKESNRSTFENAINVLNLKGKRYVLKQYSLYSQQEKVDTYIKNVTDTDFISEDDVKSINRGRYPDLCIEFFEHFESIHRSLTITLNRAEIISIERIL